MPAKLQRGRHRVQERSEQAIQEAFDQRGDLSPEGRERLQADFQLQLDFPGEWVAYLDCWKRVGKRRVLRRRVLAHSKFLREVHPALVPLTRAERSGAVVHFVTDPQETTIEVHYDLPGR